VAIPPPLRKSNASRHLPFLQFSPLLSSLGSPDSGRYQTHKETSLERGSRMSAPRVSLRPRHVGPSAPLQDELLANLHTSSRVILRSPPLGWGPITRLLKHLPVRPTREPFTATTHNGRDQEAVTVGELRAPAACGVSILHTRRGTVEQRKSRRRCTSVRRPRARSGTPAMRRRGRRRGRCTQ
jgi:hypothetical protein